VDERGTNEEKPTGERGAGKEEATMREGKQKILSLEADKNNNVLTCTCCGMLYPHCEIFSWDLCCTLCSLWMMYISKWCVERLE
jgi:hypothetical protein